MEDAQSKIMKIFKKYNPLENYFVKIQVPDSYFLENYKEKIWFYKDGAEFIIFKIDVYFDKFSLAIDIDTESLTNRELVFEEKRIHELKVKLNCNFIVINSFNTRNGYHSDYEISEIVSFIDEYKNKKMEELEDKIFKLKGDSVLKRVKELNKKMISDKK